jgi:hypothetical protein
MKKTIADLAPTPEQLPAIHALSPGKPDAAELAVIPMLVIDETPTAYFTKPDAAWFARAFQNITGDEGVSLQLNHKTNELPTGRLFDARLVTAPDGTNSLEAHAFLTVAGNEDFLNKYLSGTVKAVSATVGYDSLICGICGNEWLSDACIKAADDAGQNHHWPGDTFAGKLCILTFPGTAPATQALLDVSPVYCGASKGRLKLAAKDAKHETIEQALALRDKFIKNAFKLSLELAADDAAADDRSDPSDQSDHADQAASPEAALAAAREQIAELEVAPLRRPAAAFPRRRKNRRLRQRALRRPGSTRPGKAPAQVQHLRSVCRRGESGF